MARANEDAAEEAKSLANLAWVHRLNGLVAQAAEEYAALLPMVDPERQTYLYAVLLNNYGHCLIVLGDFDRALKLHTEALELFTQNREGSRARHRARGARRPVFPRGRCGARDGNVARCHRRA